MGCMCTPQALLKSWQAIPPHCKQSRSQKDGRLLFCCKKCFKLLEQAQVGPKAAHYTEPPKHTQIVACPALQAQKVHPSTLLASNKFLGLQHLTAPSIAGSEGRRPLGSHHGWPHATWRGHPRRRHTCSSRTASDNILPMQPEGSNHSGDVKPCLKHVPPQLLM